MRISQKCLLWTSCVCLGVSLITVTQSCATGAAERIPEAGRTEPSAGASAPSPSTAVGPGSTGPTRGPADAQSSFSAVFVDMAQRLAPVRVYGWVEFPEGATVAPEWWPVIDCRGPDEDQGPARANPWIDQDPVDPEAQLVVSIAGGWLVVLENFRGDLGDVSGPAVGDVNGNAAELYEVNGGHLVQWSDGGKWYGVFGRGVAPDLVVSAALEMRPVPQ